MLIVAYHSFVLLGPTIDVQMCIDVVYHTSLAAMLIVAYHSSVPAHQTTHTLPGLVKRNGHKWSGTVTIQVQLTHDKCIVGNQQNTEP